MQVKSPQVNPQGRFGSGFYNRSMSVIALGLNHSTAPLDVRGRFAFAPEQLATALLGFRERIRPHAHPEAALLSTCNRTELYFAAEHGQPGELVRPAIDWLAAQGSISGDKMLDHTYVLEDRAAARHAFRVASGLDSMVLGEPQILGQMKEAVRHAESAGTLGSTLHQLFQRSFSVAKEVRSSTEIGSHSVSMAAASVRLASQLFEDLAQIRVLFVGAGEMVELVATHFAARQPQVHGRGQPHARARREAGQPLRRAGAAPGRPAAGPARIRRRGVLHRQHPADHRPGRGGTRAEGAAPPADVHGRPGGAARHRARGRAACPTSTCTRWTTWPAWCRARAKSARPPSSRPKPSSMPACRALPTGSTSAAAVPLIQALNRQADDWRGAEMARARKLLARGEDIDHVLDALARGLTQKMLHGTLAELHSTDGTQREQLAQTVSRLFLRQTAPRPRQRRPLAALSPWARRPLRRALARSRPLPCPAPASS